MPGTFKPIVPPCRIRFGDNSLVDAVGIGKLELRARASGRSYDVELRVTLLVPSFSLSLVSVPKLCKAKLSANFAGTSCTVHAASGKTSIGQEGTLPASRYSDSSSGSSHGCNR